MREIVIKRILANEAMTPIGKEYKKGGDAWRRAQRTAARKNELDRLDDETLLDMLIEQVQDEVRDRYQYSDVDY